MKKLFLLFVAFVATTSLWAYDFQSGNLYYTITSETTVQVTYIQLNKYDDNYSSLITTATIPSTVTYNGTTYSVTSIRERAFYNCSSLTSVTIGNSVKWIGYEAFMNCSSLTSVTIGNSVISIGVSAFLYCESLAKTNYTGDIAGWCNIKFGNGMSNPMYYSHNFYINDQEIKDLVIPNSVTSIGNSAFYDCRSLFNITIPNSVTSIGNYAFYVDEYFITVICEAVEVPELGFDVFNNEFITLTTLYVPAQSLDDYKAAYQWKDFGRILPLEEAPSAVENTRLPIANGAKLLRNGQLIILRDGVEYNAMGQEIQ